MAAQDLLAVIPQARYELDRRRRQSANAELWQLLDQVKDPEVPVLSIWELGVLQDVAVTDNGTVQVTLTPTYSGCPALTMMAETVTETLRANGHPQVEVVTQLAPAWTTDWLTADAREKLRGYGVAPPGAVRCPQCNSTDVQLISEFGSTACKALYRCGACLEPFDHFKAL
ncbi:MAG: 1,2-phenylacetyl-CoA epoxidase subunit PaaD [Pseudomonadales bacterium]